MKERIWKKLNRIVNIFFADAKESWERITCLFSALFWTWLEFTFLRGILFFMMALGVYAGANNIETSMNILLRNNEFIDLFIKLYFILVLVLRVGVTFRSPINKEKDE